MKQVFYTILFFSALSFQVTAQDNSIFPKGEISTTDNHTGTIWLSELNKPDSIFNFSLAQAVYAPTAKLDWHVHPAGQYLLITEGIGYYQERGKPVQLVQKGDVIKCLPGVEHWHSAAHNSDFAYIGVTPTQKGKTIWLKRVTDKEYNNIKLPKENSTNRSDTNAQKEIKDLSKQKWQWMSDKNVDSLNGLFDDKAMFVHMGGSWGKTQELDVIKSGGIWYKKAEVYSVTVNMFGNTAILLNDIDLEAVVGGNTVTNPFMVTEVYIKENGKWKMGSLTFSHLLRPVKMK
jgi:4-carboxymuconolactone decarboxylase